MEKKSSVFKNRFRRYGAKCASDVNSGGGSYKLAKCKQLQATDNVNKPVTRLKFTCAFYTSINTVMLYLKMYVIQYNTYVDQPQC